MSRIKGSNTKPEIIVRSYLHKKGFRYTLHNSKLPGKPDICLPKYKTVIFVHGCFWHRHKGCKFAYTPKSRIDFWNRKLKGNVLRDERNKSELIKKGWQVSIIWECEVKQKETFTEKIETIISALLSQIP